MSTDWRQRAACRGADTAKFFPERGQRFDEVVALCASCPVREPCLEFALAAGCKEGVWGGTSENERRRLRRTVDGNVVDPSFVATPTNLGRVLEPTTRHRDKWRDRLAERNAAEAAARRAQVLSHYAARWRDEHRGA